MLETQRDLELIRYVNNLFYEALESRDLDKMSGVWARAGDVRCIHPGWELLTGWESIRSSFEAIFANPEPFRITLTDVQISFHGTIAIVHLVERLLSGGASHGSFCEVQTTNIFTRRLGGWKMIRHHSSPFIRRMTAPPLSLN